MAEDPVQAADTEQPTERYNITRNVSSDAISQPTLPPSFLWMCCFTGLWASKPFLGLGVGLQVPYLQVGDVLLGGVVQGRGVDVEAREGIVAVVQRCLGPMVEDLDTVLPVG